MVLLHALGLPAISRIAPYNGLYRVSSAGMASVGRCRETATSAAEGERATFIGGEVKVAS